MLLGAILAALVVAFAQGENCEGAPENLGSPGSCNWIPITTYTAAGIAAAGIVAAGVSLRQQGRSATTIALAAWLASAGITIAVVLIGDARY